MENGLTFRFEASDLKAILADLKDPLDHVWVTFYLTTIAGTKTVEMKAIAQAFKQQSSTSQSVPSGNPTGGCPVPPCALTPVGKNDPECLKEVARLLNEKK